MKFSERFESAILALSPSWAASRRAARQRLAEADALFAAKTKLRAAVVDAQAERIKASVWQSASTTTRPGSNWLTSRLSPDSELELDHAELRRRSRQQFRDNPLIASFVNGLVENVIGAGMRPQARIGSIPGFSEDDSDVAEEFGDELEDQFQVWAESAGSRGESFEELQRLACRTWAMDGEALLVMSDLPSADRVVPLTIEVIDVERLETPPEKIGDSRCRLGVEKDAKGLPVAYWIRRHHPGDTWTADVQYDRIPADRVLHLFEPLFAGQTRGIPPAAHVLDLCKVLDEFAEAKLISAQIAACFSVFVETPTDPSTLALAQMTELTVDEKRIEDISPGQINYLNLGQKISFANPAVAGAGYSEFVMERKRAIAAGLNYPYELLTKDYTGCNYSVGRLSLIDGRMAFKTRQNVFKTRVCRPVWKRFVTEAVIVGAVDLDARLFIENKTAFCGHTWIAPGWAWIDPVKEIAASTEAIRTNQSTLTDELAAQGRDFDETVETRKREVKILRAAGLPTLTEAAPGSPVGAAGQVANDTADTADSDTADQEDANALQLAV